jgi:hypothetical protein
MFVLFFSNNIPAWHIPEDCLATVIKSQQQNRIYISVSVSGPDVVFKNLRDENFDLCVFFNNVACFVGSLVIYLYWWF